MGFIQFFVILIGMVFANTPPDQMDVSEETTVGTELSGSISSSTPDINICRLKKTRSVQVLEVNDDKKRALVGNAIELPENAEVVVLEKNGNRMRIGIDVNADEELPTDVWVDSNLENDCEMVSSMAMDEINSLLNSNAEVDLTGDSDSYETMVAGKKGAKKGTGGRRKKGMTYCYREVKNYLLKIGFCKKYPGGERASQGYSVLRSSCGMRTGGSAKNPKKGTVCVSSGGRSCGKGTTCGHIAVWNGKCWYGAGCKSSPWIAGRKPMGCLTKG